jgi:polyferredoxin
MLKVNKPKGLIRYASYDSIAEKKQTLFTTRVKAYSVVLLLLVSFLSVALLTRSEIETTILKVPGQLYQRQENDRISNLFNMQFVNKTNEEIKITLEIEDIPGATVSHVGESDMLIEPNALAEGIYFISLPEEQLAGMQTEVTIKILGNGEEIEKQTIKFLGPATVNN